jgi:hypothetical protein
MTLQSKLQTGATTYPTPRFELSPPAQRIADSLYKAETYVRTKLNLSSMVNTASDLYTSWRDHATTLEGEVRSTMDFVYLSGRRKKAEKAKKEKTRAKKKAAKEAKMKSPGKKSKYARKQGTEAQREGWDRRESAALDQQRQDAFDKDGYFQTRRDGYTEKEFKNGTRTREYYNGRIEHVDKWGGVEVIQEERRRTSSWGFSSSLW